MRKQGIKNRDTVRILGISERHASTTWQRYLKERKTSIDLGRQGRRHGEQRTLNSEQERELKNLAINKTPDQLKLPFELWKRDAVKEVVRDRYGMEMPIRTVGGISEDVGFHFEEADKEGL